MAKQYPSLNDDLIRFIKHQKMYFVGTAANNGTVNVSPKGYDSLRVVDTNRIVWLNITGSGNETAAHLAQNTRMTMMFCAFDGNPRILRLYGKAVSIHPRDPQWDELSAMFEPHASARQYVDFSIEMAQTSCGFGVPFYEFKEERDNMDRWVAAKGEVGIPEYWEKENQFSIDGLPTHILKDK
ncbi:MAG: pyridoxamine 5'-phosphate oxidase [SAR86 cluster bacterium]|uniref:Pyridoxamine 5'-phosphate oxidase n=1 Tax=SAR86 cluster bacterium TaxID=2030880 RepID=A0A2A5AUZ5_9GAMM|nr:MAG: pyridoxamine 5'-phosphate oxidase [SAR86 cluster bacterium]